MLCAPRVFVNRSADLQRLVGGNQRDEGRIADAGVAGRVHRRQRRGDGVDVRVLESERGAEILSVVERQRLDVAVHVADPELRHQRRAVDVQVVRLEAVRLGGVLTGERPVVAARLDAVHDGERARRERVDVVVGIAGEQRVVVVEAVIDPEVGGAAVLGAVARAGEIIRQPRRRRRRVKGDVIQRDRVEPARRDEVAGERGARGGGRIVNRHRELGEVAGAHLHRRHGRHEGEALRQLEALVVAEEERLVLLQRTADAAAELILIERRLRPGGREEVAGVEPIVPVELETRSVEVVRPGLGDDVDDATRGAADFGGVHVGLDFHLRDRVDRRLDDHGADVALVVVDAVQQLVVLVVHRAVDRDRRRLAAIVGAGAAGERVRHAFVRARHELHQPHEVAPVHRQILHGLLGDQRTERRRIGLHERRLGGDRDVFRNGADLQLHVESRAIARRQRHVRGLGRESLKLDLHGVAADRQQAEGIVAGAFGRHDTGLVRADVLDGDGHTGQHGAGAVGHAADDVGRGDLSGGHRREDEATGEDAGTPTSRAHTVSLPLQGSAGRNRLHTAM